jgi:glutathione S-transferase
MVKLYYTCSSSGAACFVAAYVAQLSSLESEQVDMATHTTTLGFRKRDYYDINPRGSVPCLVLDDRTVLSETVSILTCIGALDRSNSVLAPLGTAAYFLTLDLLSFISSELHALVASLFNPSLDDAQRASLRAKLCLKLSYIEKNIFEDGCRFLVNGTYSVADSYLYTVLTWVPFAFRGVSEEQATLAEYPRILEYMEAIESIPQVQEALAHMEANPSHVIPGNADLSTHSHMQRLP